MYLICPFLYGDVVSHNCFLGKLCTEICFYFSTQKISVLNYLYSSALGLAYGLGMKIWLAFLQTFSELVIPRPVCILYYNYLSSVKCKLNMETSRCRKLSLKIIFRGSPHLILVNHHLECNTWSYTTCDELRRRSYAQI